MYPSNLSQGKVYIFHLTMTFHGEVTSYVSQVGKNRIEVAFRMDK